VVENIDCIIYYFVKLFLVITFEAVLLLYLDINSIASQVPLLPLPRVHVLTVNGLKAVPVLMMVIMPGGIARWYKRYIRNIRRRRLRLLLWGWGWSGVTEYSVLWGPGVDSYGDGIWFYETLSTDLGVLGAKGLVAVRITTET
jgi:hypothetical protein